MKRLIHIILTLSLFLFASVYFSTSFAQSCSGSGTASEVKFNCVDNGVSYDCVPYTDYFTTTCDTQFGPCQRQATASNQIGCDMSFGCQPEYGGYSTTYTTAGCTGGVGYSQSGYYGYAQPAYYSYSYNYSYSYSQATYSVSGNVVEDDNRNKKRDPGEILHRVDTSLEDSDITIRADNPSTGNYRSNSISAGDYNLQYSEVPLGYELTWPLSGIGGLFRIQLGGGCDIQPSSGDGDCNNGSITNLNYGITRSIAWIQAKGGDIRMDSGFDFPIPLEDSVQCNTENYAADKGNANAPGIIFTGNRDPDFGDGEASSKGWVVGGTLYPELYTPQVKGLIKSSYTYMYAKLERQGIQMDTLLAEAGSQCQQADDCEIKQNLQSGVYEHNGNLVLMGFDQNEANRNYVFLVSGYLRIRGPITLGSGSTAHFFVKGDISVWPEVGRETEGAGENLGCNLQSGQLEGVYSTEDDFLIRSEVRDPDTGEIDCNRGADKQLNINGSIIVNAGLTDGRFVQERSLCTPDSRDVNANFPAVTMRERPDFVLNAPPWVKDTSYIWQEVAP